MGSLAARLPVFDGRELLIRKMLKRRTGRDGGGFCAGIMQNVLAGQSGPIIKREYTTVGSNFNLLLQSGEVAQLDVVAHALEHKIRRSRRRSQRPADGGAYPQTQPDPARSGERGQNSDRRLHVRSRDRSCAGSSAVTTLSQSPIQGARTAQRDGNYWKTKPLRCRAAWSLVGDSEQSTVSSYPARNRPHDIR